MGHGMLCFAASVKVARLSAGIRARVVLVKGLTKAVTSGYRWATRQTKIRNFSIASVAEPVDAPDSKSGTREGVGVRVPPEAPKIARRLAALFIFCIKSIASGAFLIF